MKSNFRQYGHMKSRDGESQRRKSEEKVREGKRRENKIKEEKVRESQKKEDPGARKGRRVAQRYVFPT